MLMDRLGITSITLNTTECVHKLVLSPVSSAGKEVTENQSVFVNSRCRFLINTYPANVENMVSS